MTVVVGLTIVNDVIKTTDVFMRGGNGGGPPTSRRASNGSSSFDTGILLIVYFIILGCNTAKVLVVASAVVSGRNMFRKCMYRDDDNVRYEWGISFRQSIDL